MIGQTDAGGQVWGKLGPEEEAANGFTGFFQRFRSLTPVIQQGLNLAVQIIGFQEVPVGLSGGGKPVGHRNALILEGANHFPQRGVLAAHQGHIGVAQGLKPAHIPLVVVHIASLS